MQLLLENLNIKRIENPGRKSVLYFDQVRQSQSIFIAHQNSYLNACCAILKG
jgi:hypothetical protein